MPIWFGGDYNPEQWPSDVWAEDVTLMQRAGVTMATVGVFSWAKLEPREGEFEFGWLDEVLDGLHAGGIRVDLATATASPPPWLTHAYPEVLPVTAEGVTLGGGSRQQYSPSSPVYRRFATRLVRQLAERYGEHPALEMWHIGNEYGCHVSHDYSDVAAAAFRLWLQEKYGDIGALNFAWGTGFWSQQYADFEEIYPPRAAPTYLNPTQLLDFDRFSSRQLLECYLDEKRILRELTPQIPVTTNFMGFFKGADYWEWAPHVDIVSNDNYPDPADPESSQTAAMVCDLMRSLGGGAPWILMEQATSAVNWRTSNAPKRPHHMRAGSYQAVARGADGILFFQWRQSVAGAEKFHSALLPHAGPQTRVFREVEELGAELAGLGEVLGSRLTAHVAIVFDWASWWSLEQEATPADIDYVKHVFSWYRELLRRNVAVDFVKPGASVDGYKAVLVPALFAASTSDLAVLSDYAEHGGNLLVTFQSGITDENLHITEGGYLGSLQKTLGITVEEFAPLASADPNAPVESVIEGEISGSVAVWREYLHADDAQILASFVDDLAGWPAITRRQTAEGTAWYVGTWPSAAVIESIVGALLETAGVDGVLDPVPGLEAVRRGELVFALNHGWSPVELSLSGTDILSPGGAGGAGGAEGTKHALEAQGVAIVVPAAEVAG
ncbi:beta-galactosidase [Subtercola endophyticus]|uniref:beta-galactosidase n=1 Tax=Subtercola endophyticus TaxID=2895559 RepID=UPI001E32B0EC|nr:beta-galactosidase [Subtercola endophyticus]UFS58733.1 beta-galactosidase [Subtercola endophyticus]